jgi:hypothetical protein
VSVVPTSAGWSIKPGEGPSIAVPPNIIERRSQPRVNDGRLIEPIPQLARDPRIHLAKVNVPQRRTDEISLIQHRHKPLDNPRCGNYAIAAINAVDDGQSLVDALTRSTTSVGPLPARTTAIQLIDPTDQDLAALRAAARYRYRHEPSRYA